VRLSLVLVGDRGEIIASLVGVAVLDGDPDVPLERHQIFDVEPVEADVPAPIITSAKGDAVVGSVVLLPGAPSCVSARSRWESTRGRLFKDGPCTPIYAVLFPLPCAVLHCIAFRWCQELQVA
jgi:hypothetical protein